MNTTLSPGRIKRISFLIAVILAIAFIPFFSAAQESKNNELAQEQRNEAPVKLDGNILFYVQGISSYPAEQRAAIISDRIRKAAANPRIHPDSVKVIPKENAFMIYAGPELMLMVGNADAEATNVEPQLLAELFQRNIKKAIHSYRSERSQPVLIKKVLYAIGAVALLALVLFLFTRISRRINIRLQNRLKRRIEGLESQSFKLIQSTHLWKAFHTFFNTIKTILIIIIILSFVEFILGLFPWTKGFAAGALNLLLDPVLSLGRGFVGFLPNLVFLIVIFLITRYVLSLVRMLFTGIKQGGIAIKNFDPDWAMPTYDIARVLVIAVAVVIAYPYIPGSQSDAFKGISVFLGVLFSLGSSSFIGNLIAGYSMTYRRAFKKGDRIKVDDSEGYVEEQKLLVTRLRSVKNEEIVIPNSELLNSSIINYSTGSRGTGLILHTTVRIGYETSWRKVDAMLKIAADRTEGLLKEPPSFVLKKSLDEFAVLYEINVYCNDPSRINHYYNLLHQNILDVFNENNVQIMTPAYEGDPATAKVVPKEDWDVPLAGDRRSNPR